MDIFALTFTAVFTGSIARSARRRYLIYPEADFEVFDPQGRHLAPMWVKFGMEEGTEVQYNTINEFYCIVLYCTGLCIPCKLLQIDRMSPAVERFWWLVYETNLNTETETTSWCTLVKAKFHYASWFGAGSKLVRSRIPLRYLVRTIFEPASVMEFGSEPVSSC